MRIRDTDSKMLRNLFHSHSKAFSLGDGFCLQQFTKYLGKAEKIKRFVPAERATVELHGAGDEDEAGAQLLQHNHTLTLQLYNEETRP
jgi:hypothetical protein